MRNNLQAYNNVSKVASLETADSHQVIQALMQGALERMAQAKGAIQRNNIDEKHDRVQKTIGILEGLQQGINFDIDHDISDNFHGLYDYMIRRMIDAGAEMSVEPIDECIALLSPILEAWTQIPMEVRAEVIEKQAQQLHQEQSEKE